LRADEEEDLSFAEAGDIVAVVGLKNTATGNNRFLLSKFVNCF
jgi:translation elongation factor EF-G